MDPKIFHRDQKYKNGAKNILYLLTLGGEGDSAGLFFPAIVATGTALSPKNQNATLIQILKYVLLVVIPVCKFLKVILRASLELLKKNKVNHYLFFVWHPLEYFRKFLWIDYLCILLAQYLFLLSGLSLQSSML